MQKEHRNDEGVKKEHEKEHEGHVESTAGAVRAILVRTMHALFKNPLKLFKPKRGGIRKNLNIVTLGRMATLGLWSKINLPPLAANIFVNTLLFIVYENVKDNLQGEKGSSCLHSVAGGFVGGLLISPLSVPFDNFAHRVSPERIAVGGIFKETKHVLLTSGVFELFKGMKVSAIRDSVGYGLFFGSFVYIKDYFQEFRKKSKWANLCAIFFAGGIAGMIYQMICYPINAYMGLGAYQASHVHIRDLFRGYSKTVLTTYFSSAVAFIVFEWLGENFENENWRVNENRS
jgi:hypothetical protein